MPRPVESPEGKILRYFREAPPATAKLLLGLIQDQQRAVPAAHTHDRFGRPAPASGQGRHKAAAEAPAPAKPKKSHHKQAAPAGGAGGKKKSHHKKVNAGTGKRQQTNEAEVESFSLPERG